MDLAEEVHFGIQSHLPLSTALFRQQEEKISSRSGVYRCWHEHGHPAIANRNDHDELASINKSGPTDAEAKKQFSSCFRRQTWGEGYKTKCSLCIQSVVETAKHLFSQWKYTQAIWNNFKRLRRTMEGDVIWSNVLIDADATTHQNHRFA